MKDEIRKGFPPSISFPEELGLLCDWTAQYGYPISGGFELRADDGEAVYWWFRSHAADDRLAQFGGGSDGSLYCVWKQADGREPIVHMGSEGDSLMVLAGNMREFITLLAVGYGEIGSEDLAVPPESSADVNPKFQRWVEETFSVTVPAIGQGIVEEATRSHEDFRAFVGSITNSGKG